MIIKKSSKQQTQLAMTDWLPSTESKDCNHMNSI